MPCMVGEKISSILRRNTVQLTRLPFAPLFLRLYIYSSKANSSIESQNTRNIVRALLTELKKITSIFNRMFRIIREFSNIRLF